MTDVQVGSIVRILAPGSRESDGEQRVIPAVVIGQWPDGSLQLYALHFQGSPVLMNSVRPQSVEVAFNPEAIHRRLVEREKQLAAIKPGWRPPDYEPKYLPAADDAR